MTLTATYDPQISRVRLEQTLGSGDGEAYVERSIDQIRWSPVRGGSPVQVIDGHFMLDDYEFTPNVTNYYRAQGETASVLPEITEVWLKSISRPWLNKTVEVVDFSDITRRARAGVFDVIGRSMPVAVNDVRGGREFTLTLYTATDAEYRDLDIFTASGDPIFIQVPAGSRVPAGYFTVSDVQSARLTQHSGKRVFELPLIECAAPGPAIVGASVTWLTVLNSYASWSEVLAAHATWADMLELIGDPTEVIVP